LRQWGSRGFVLPLLLTVVGVIASVALYLTVARSASGPSESPCNNGPDVCGYVLMGSLGQAFAVLPVLLIGLVITGLVVGLSSRDSRLAFRAILVGTLLGPMAGGAVLAVPGSIADGHDVAFKIVSILAGAALVGLILLIPVALGYGIGRAVRPRTTDRSGAKGPE
jgi:hypothetical protein